MQRFARRARKEPRPVADPLRCEAILLSILVFLAVILAWLLVFEDLTESASPSPGR